MSVDVKFTVKVDTSKGQCVCLVGNDTRLGSWDPLRAVEMEREFTGQNWKQWTCSVTLDRNATYGYRFFVCKRQMALKNGEMKSVTTHPSSFANGFEHNDNLPITIFKWETNIRPRHLSTENCGSTLIVPEASFGKYDGSFHIAKGWLVNQYEVQIRLHSNPIYMWKTKRREQMYSIKCIAMDYATQGSPRLDSSDDDSREGPCPFQVDDVLVCNLGHDECRPELQGPAGMLYNKDDYVVFRSPMPDPQQQGFQLDFFVCESNRAPRFVGSAHLLPIKLKESQSSRKCPIIGCNHKPIGEVMVEYLLGKPVSGLKFSMDISYQTHFKWKEIGEKSLDIGHRGMGASYSQVNALKENTVASFLAAGKHGADFVEFDVLLSKDKQAVIYHDFSVKVKYSTKKTHKVQSELFEIPVKSLTLTQLQSMRLFASTAHQVEINKDETGEESTEPFPTLEQVLQVVDENTGFDIEIKFPQQDVNDVWEMDNYFDVNDNIDQILKVVFANAGSRKIVFSSFDPDTCILLQLKQNKYPVLLLHQGLTELYVPYKDYRAFIFKNGISFAVSENLLGVALHSEVLLKDMDLIDRVLKKNLVLFVWGNDNNNPTMIRRLRDLKVHGIIYDRNEFA
uniref:GP-PDE domain-containing protein n=1 Tax=Arion vulgaris TaxID=1028688 RepID=A0A0B6ZSX6_9EUPU